MNAYAEGALPEAARSRYFAHMADCDACRKLVTQLTLAATASAEGRERAVAAQTAAPSKSWRERLAALLSPQVLRYAVPALALFAVVVVALVVMRANRDASFVARNEQNATRPAPSSGTTAANSAAQQAPAETAGNHINGNAGPSVMTDSEAKEQPEATGPTDAPTTAEKAPADKDGTPAAQPTPASTTTAQSEDARTASREVDQPTGGRRAQQEEVQVAAAPPPPPRPAQEPVLAAPTAAGETSMRDEQENKPKTEDEGKDDDISTGTVAKKAEANRERRDTGRSEGAGATSTRSGVPTASKRAPAGAVAENEAPSDMRRVGGRNFRRQGGAWVDTAYNPSRPTTNVHRGSEQYRTLVADEPGLRTITDQLGGEVFVVWKSRSYRFY